MKLSPHGPGRCTIPVVVVVVASAVCGCATNATAVVRDLPVNLQPIGRLLDGCEHSAEVDGAVVARCRDDLLLRVRDVEGEEGATPRYLGDGVDLANASAGRMVWDTVALKTAVDKGAVDRGQVRSVSDDSVVVVLLGAARRKPDQHTQKEISCQAPPGELERCEHLLVAFLDLPDAELVPEAPVVAGGPSVSHGTVHGRAISLPTSCSVVDETAEHGRYACADEAKLYWLITAEMDDAAAQADAALTSLAEGEERRAVDCALLDADARCEATTAAIVGLGYIEGQPIVVVCAAPDPWNHGLCRSSFRRR